MSDDEAPTSEPSTLITNVSPANEASHGPKPPSPIGGDTPSVVIAPDRPSSPEAAEQAPAKKTRTRMTLRIPDDEVARPSQLPNPSHSPAPPASVASASPAPPAVHAPVQALPAEPPTQPAPVVRPPITAQRIISLNVDTPTNQIRPFPAVAPAAVLAAVGPLPAVSAPPVKQSSSPAPPPAVTATKPDEDSWTPFQPPVAPAAVAADEDSWTPFQPTVVEHESSVEIQIDTSESSEPGIDVSSSRDAVLPHPTIPEPAREVPAVAAAPRPAIAPTPPRRPPGSSDDFTDVVVDEGDEATVAVPKLEAEPARISDAVTIPRIPIHRLPPLADITVRESPAPVDPTLPPARPRNDATLDLEEISVDSSPPPSSSEPAESSEISPEDVVSVEAPVAVARTSPSVPPPPMRPRASSVPSFAAVVAPTAPRASNPGFPAMSRETIKTTVSPEHIQDPTKSKPLNVPPASPLAPPPMAEATTAVRKRARPWWEDLFNDDFIRTMAKITDAQIAKEVDFIDESLGLDKGAMVLDLACGTGRHAIELTRRGYQVVGFDLSLSMLAKAADEAQDRSQKLNFVQGDMREMTFDGTFDGVYCWNTSFGFFEEEKNAAVIANVRRALKPGGQVLLDVVNRDFVAQQCPSLVWFEGDGCVCMDDMTIDWITSRMRVKRTMMMDDGRSREIEYSIRLYALHELGKLLHENGFRVVQVSGRVETPGVFFGANSPRTLILAEKK
jgi:SAM-dependent methyltransferase